MYESPIELIQKQMQLDLESKIMSAVQEVGININKEELIRALKYDRDQYEKGYADAKAEQGDTIPVEWIVNFKNSTKAGALMEPREVINFMLEVWREE